MSDTETLKSAQAVRHAKKRLGTDYRVTAVEEDSGNVLMTVENFFGETLFYAQTRVLMLLVGIDVKASKSELVSYTHDVATIRFVF